MLCAKLNFNSDQFDKKLLLLLNHVVNERLRNYNLIAEPLINSLQESGVEGYLNTRLFVLLKITSHVNTRTPHYVEVFMLLLNRLNKMTSNTPGYTNTVLELVNLFTRCDLTHVNPK